MNPAIQLEGQRVLVVGLARTGAATALFCAARGARVTATDEHTAAQLGATLEPLRSAGCALELGGHKREIFLQQDLIVPSPGVSASLPALADARAAGIPLWSEVELASRFLRGRLIAITGSNGKTTTTALIAHILTGAGKRVILAGNIGSPLIAHADESTDATLSVVEMSSFQLELIESLRPDVGVLLNLTPDHLDRHGSFEAYAAAKMRLFENQTAADAAVLNADDAAVAQRVPGRPQVYWFSRQKEVTNGAYIKNGEIVFRQAGQKAAPKASQEITLLACNDVQLRGQHNLENVLAAASAAFLAGATPQEIAAGVRSFPGVEHRLEFVAEVAGVSYFNDSKATNVDATLKALEAFSSGLFVILGGKDKAGDFTILRGPLRQRAKWVLLIGAAADKIESQLQAAVPVERAGTLQRAVAEASRRAQPGDTVLLAPACASFDQFENFEHRGRVFKSLVHSLQTESSGAVRKV